MWRFISVLSGIALIGVLTLSGCAQKRATEVVTAHDLAKVTDQIAANWNYDPNAAAQCSEKIKLRVHLEADGTVSKVEMLNDLANDICRAASESARRAVLITKRLLFSGPAPKELTLIFDPSRA